MFGRVRLLEVVMPCKYTQHIIFCGTDGGFTVGRVPKPRRRREAPPDERIDPADPRLPFDPTAENEAGYRERMKGANRG